MKEFTKEERNAVYRLALEKHLHDRKMSIDIGISQRGLCGLILNSAYEIFDAAFDEFDVSDFPEFVALKPGYYTIHSYWWSTYSRNTEREEALLKIIKMTE